jgi:hypothetical protein
MEKARAAVLLEDGVVYPPAVGALSETMRGKGAVSANLPEIIACPGLRWHTLYLKFSAARMLKPMV